MIGMTTEGMNGMLGKIIPKGSLDPSSTVKSREEGSVPVLPQPNQNVHPQTYVRHTLEPGQYYIPNDRVSTYRKKLVTPSHDSREFPRYQGVEPLRPPIQPWRYPFRHNPNFNQWGGVLDRKGWSSRHIEGTVPTVEQVSRNDGDMFPKPMASARQMIQPPRGLQGYEGWSYVSTLPDGLGILDVPASEELPKEKSKWLEPKNIALIGLAAFLFMRMR